VVDGLTRKNDKQFGNPWGSQPLSNEELDAMLNEVVGIRIHIEEIIGKYKRIHAGEETGMADMRSQSEARSVLIAKAQE